MVASDALETWIALQAQRSTAALERAISATHLVRRRDAFGQVVIPIRGSVLASPEIADWNPEPDYFFHWLRDSAIVMRTVAELMQDAADIAERARWQEHFEDFIDFSLDLVALDGAAFLATSRHRQATRRGFRKYLRPDRQLRALRGERLLGEPRFNPDGTIDIFRWSRPQYDGPALRALACLAYLGAGGPPSDSLDRLLRRDLDFTLRHAGRPCIGPWEEAGENARHYYAALVQLGALVHGGTWAGTRSAAWRAAERRLRTALDRHWSERHGFYMAFLPAADDAPDALLDGAALLAVLDADLPEGPHSVLDPRAQATLAALERLFARILPINRGRSAGHGPALGRSAGDRYFGGGAWYVTTLAAAAFHYRLARRPGQDANGLVARGDSFMATVKALTPADGSMAEQVDRTTGAPASARNLSWSYAAFLSTARLRRLAGAATA